MMVTTVMINVKLLGVISLFLFSDVSDLIIVEFSKISGMIVDGSCVIELITAAKIVIDV